MQTMQAGHISTLEADMVVGMGGLEAVMEMAGLEAVEAKVGVLLSWLQTVWSLSRENGGYRRASSQPVLE